MQRKFRNDIGAHRVAAMLGMVAKKGKACKLKDGTKAHWWTFTKGKRKTKYGKVYPVRKKKKR